MLWHRAQRNDIQLCTRSAVQAASLAAGVSWHSRVLAACRLVKDGQADSTDQDHAEAAAALLAADGGLRAALAEGLALFALAAARPDGSAAPTGGTSCLAGRLVVPTS